MLEKHKKYKNMYGEAEVFWGVGIEEETYFQFTKPIHVAAPILRSCHAAERYSVSYYLSYKTGRVEDAFTATFPDASACIPLPFFVNSHSFQKVDLSGNHETLYTKGKEANPQFSGKSMFKELQEFSPEVFLDGYEQWFCFDGDSTEFITLNFYKSRVSSCIEELIGYKKEFLDGLNRFIGEKKLWRDRGTLIYPPRNPGFAVFSSNPGNIAMFNNGTYHINITLPTFLAPRREEEEIAQILYPDLFREDHRRYIRLIQWMEPILIAVYGSPDPFSKGRAGFAHGSQRCAMSRYIGIGTYDTVAMKEGKILQVEVGEVRAPEFWWFSTYHKESAYVPLEKIGIDVNYRKHFNHGVELRFFDWFPEEKLTELCSFLVYLADASMNLPIANEAILSETWNDCVLGMLEHGAKWILPPILLATYERILHVSLYGKELTFHGVYSAVLDTFKKRYGKGLCAKLML